MTNIERRISILEKKIGVKEAGGDYSHKNYNYKPGDVVGNTVQGFNFKVLKFLPNNVVLVKDTKTGEQSKIYKDSIYLPSTKVKESRIQSKSSFNEEADYSSISTIKFKGGTLRRFDRTDWSGYGGATSFPDGSNPFIAEDITVNSKMLFALEDSFGEPFESEAVVIFDFSDKKYTLCVQYFTGEYQAYCLIVQFSEFSQAQWWISRRLGDELNDPRNIGDIEAY